MGMNRVKCAAILLVAYALSAPVIAQDHSRNWDYEKTVWWITNVTTKPNMFNAYLNDLQNVWRKFLEAQKADGLVVSYRMFNVPFPREGEPDLILAVEYRDWSAFDTGQDYLDEQIANIMGSLDAATEAGIDREALRTIGSNILMQEIKFKE